LIDKRQRLKDDFDFYSRNCLKIRTKDKGLQPFVLNDAQRYIHDMLEKQIEKTGKARAIVLKGRQQGVSTQIGGRFIQKTTHNKGVRAFILTHDGESTNALFEMTDRFYNNLPQQVKPITSKANAKELHFELLDSGYKIGTAGNKAVGRGQTIQYFHGSEVAFWMNASEHTKGIMQAVPDADGTEVIWESTANGVGNFFHEQWKLAEKGLSEFQAIFVPWFWQSEYKKKLPDGIAFTDEEMTLAEAYDLSKEQLYWRRIKVAELTTDGVDGQKAFKQEYPMNAAEAFQVSGGDGLISASHCLSARARNENGSGPLIIGVDPSRGGDRFATIKRQGRKMYDMKSFIGEQCDSLGKNVAICVDLLDTVCPVANKKPDMMFVDAGGGVDIVDRLHELGYKKRVKAIYFGASTIKPKKYKNKRNEMWGEMADWMVDESLPVEIPDSDEMQADLCASPYDRDSNDRRVLWSKDKIKSKYGFSPDYGDAGALTFAEPVNTNKAIKLKFDTVY
jgi:hypothetical protein